MTPSKILTGSSVSIYLGYSTFDRRTWRGWLTLMNLTKGRRNWNTSI